MRKLILIIFILFCTVAEAQLIAIVQSQGATIDNTTPVLSNFSITTANPNRVYFDSNKDISTLTSTGFAISNRTISSLTIDPDNLGGYFTISETLNYYDNDKIRLTGGNGTVHDFTYEYIDNQISAPTEGANGIFYVDGSVGASGNGLTEGTAFKTLAEGLSQTIGAGGGIKIYVKAGVTYSEGSLNAGGSPYENGTATNPNVIEGYVNTIGDLNGVNYYTYVVGSNTALSNTAAPLFDGGDRTTGTFYTINNDDYYVWRNIQVTNYNVAFLGTNNSNGHIWDNVAIKDMGDLTANIGHGIRLNGSLSDATLNRVLNSTIVNCTGEAIRFNATSGLIENTKVYCNEATAGAGDTNSTTDYYFLLSGDDNIIRNSLAYKDTPNGNGHNGHGFSMKNNAGLTASFNLIDNCEAYGIYDSFEFRHANTKYNVVKNGEAHSNPSRVLSGERTGGISFFSGGSFNQVENMYIHDLDCGMMWTANSETDADVNIQFDSTIRNSLFVDLDMFARCNHIETGGTSTPYNNRIENNTIANTPILFQYISGLFTFGTNYFTNNIFYNVTTKDAGWTSVGWVYDNNLFNSGFSAEGTNTITVDPLLNASYVPTATLTSIDVPKISTVNYDKNKSERANPTTVGAIRHASEELGTVISVAGAPMLSNFKMTANDNKVYFDSSESISGTTLTGFAIPYRNITGVFINGNETTGHYFTTDFSHSYWDVTTIEYTGGSNFVDVNDGDALLPFTYEYIDNQIPEPTAPNTKYASATGGGTHDGLSEANAWSFQEMDNLATAGDHVWVKASSATGTLFFTKSGTDTNPIIYEGYKNTIGDITSNYLKGGAYADWSDSEMPTIIGTSRLSDRGWEIQELDYVIFRNLQIRECRYAILPQQLSSGDNDGLWSNVVFENVNGKDFGNTGAQADLAGYFFNGNGEAAVFTRGNKIHFKNNVVFDFSQTGILTMGDNWFFEGLEFHSRLVGNKAEVDYNVDLQGDRNVVINSSFRRYDGQTGIGGGFGVSMKARWPDGARTTRYNLVADSYFEGLAEAVNFRWRDSEFNVAKRCILDGGIQPASGGVAFRDGASFNIFENSIIRYANQDYYGFINYFDSSGEDGTGQTLEGNVVRNCLILGGNAIEEATVPAINLGLARNGTDTAWTILNNRIENCTFVDIPEMYNLNTGVTVTNFEFTNNIVVNVPIRNSTNNPTIDETYSNHWSFWGTNGVPESGTGNISINPSLNASWIPTVTFTSIDVPTISTIKQDYSGGVRNPTLTTAGWKKHANELAE